MGLEDIQKKIIADAEQKKTELHNEAHEQSDVILKTAKKTTDEYIAEQEKSALSAAENLERGLVIDARRQLANEILGQKRQRIAQVFSKAKSEFIASTEYSEIMKSLVLKSVVSKKESIILGKEEKVLDQKWLDSVNQSCSGSLVFAKEKGDFDGGLMMVEDQSFINITVNTLLGLLSKEAEKPVADILFRG